MSSLTASDSFACSAQLSLEYLSENIWKLVLAAHLTKENSIETAANTDSSENWVAQLVYTLYRFVLKS